jgi:hypothetical protein
MEIIKGKTKRCSFCKKFKKFDQFHKNRHAYYGLRSRCKICENSECRQKYSKNPQYYKNMTESSLKHRYGISIKEYNEMMDRQNGFCAICGIHKDYLNYRLFVDHNHRTGEIRGLLCPKCNAGLGSFKDDVKLLEKAIQYCKMDDPV